MVFDQRFINASTPACPSFNFRRKRFIKQLCRLLRKDLQEILNMVQVNSARRDLRRTAHVMQLGVDLYKAGSIIGCRTVYVIFLIIVIFIYKE